MEQLPTIQDIALVWFIVSTVLILIRARTIYKETEEEQEQRRLKLLGRSILPVVLVWTLYVLSIMTAF